MLIEKQDKTPKEDMKFRVDQRVAARFAEYCEYLDSDPSYVAEKLMQLAFKRDLGFQKRGVSTEPVVVKPKRGRKPKQAAAEAIAS